VPELPEVETVLRSIAPRLVGRVIESASFRSRHVTRLGFAKTAAALVGGTVQSVTRRGKHIFVGLDRGTLHIHLGMTGKLLWDAPEGKHTYAVIRLNEGTLVYDDPRQFGRMEFYTALPKSFARLAVDALAVSFEEFASRLKKHRTAIKALLLNQSFVAGIGNIYADEILFAARVHPKTPAARLSKERAKRIFDSMGAILLLAIDHRGSSISDYVDGDGSRGAFQLLHQVYGRTGEPCERCGAPIRRILIAQRSTHYCPRCQRL
jgi:formamidopyrimidine-DNA glycosylase